MIENALQILLIEDNLTDVLLLEVELEDIGTSEFAMTSAGRLDGAIALLGERHFDVVLLDLGLPDSQGLETFARLHREYSRLPILILSGLEDETIALTAVQQGAQDYLFKGAINSKMLARTMRYAIERKRSEQRVLASEENYRRLFETAQDGILILDAANGQITDANAFIVDLLGFDLSEFIGKRLWEIAPFRDKQANLAAFRTLQEQSFIRYDSLPLQTKNGRSIEVEFISNVYAVGSERVIQCNIRDISERRRTEVLEQELHRFLQSTLNALGSHIAVLDETGTIIAINQAWEEFAGANQGHVADCGVGINYLKVCDRARDDCDDEAPALAQGIRDVIAGKQSTFELEYPCHNPEEECWFSVCVTRFIGEGPVRVVVAHEDISQHKRDQAAQIRLTTEVEIERQRSQNIVANVPGVVWESWVESADSTTSEAAGNITQHVDFVSDYVTTMLGYSTQEWLQTPNFWLTIVHPEDRARAEAESRLIFSGGKGGVVDYRSIACDGRVLWIEAHMAVICDETGQPVGVRGVTTDITERKQIELALEESTREILTIWESMTDAFFSLDYDWNFTHVNQQTGLIWKRNPAELIGKNIWEEFPAARGTRFFDEYSRAARNRVALSFEAFYAPDNAWREVHVYPSTIGLSIYFRDITERKQTEANLRASDERFQSIVANVPGMVYQFLLRPDGTSEFPFVSEGSRELLEVEPQHIQIHPDSPIMFIDETDREEYESSVAESAANLTPWKWEGRFRLPSGQIKYVQGASTPQRLPDGSTLWDGLLMDVTERKVAEEERDRFFTMSLDMLCIADRNGYFKRLNPAFETTLGYSNDELMAQPFLELVHPDDRAATLEVMKELDAGAPTLKFANRYLCRDGSYRWLSWVSAPFEGLTYAVAHDITLLKDAEMALQAANDELEVRVEERTAQLEYSNTNLQSEILERSKAEASLYKNHEFLQAVLENTAEGIVACDAQGNLTLFNHATRHFHGLPLESLPTEQWPEYYSLFLPDGVTPMAKEGVPLYRALNGEHVRNLEMVIAPQNGSTRLVVSNGEPLFDSNGDKLGAVVVMHDITESKQIEMELQRAKIEAEQANAAKSEFLSRMSHELRTPLNAILGFGQILDRQDLPTRTKESVGHILKGGRHLLDLINEVLDISRVEAGHLELMLEPISLREIVPEVCALMRSLAEERGIELNDNLPQLSGYYLMTDRQRFKQVLINLLANAIKYNRTGGKVEISCEAKPNGWLAVSIHDTGNGIAAEDLSKLFTPFERLGATNSTVEGTGLGLVLSRRLVTAMGGSLSVHSVVGQGTTFTAELPQAAPPGKTQNNSLSAAGSTPATRAEGKHNHCVLCIEDNLSNMKLMEAILEMRTDWNLMPAIQGSIGLDLARRHQPDLILLDLDLPDISGKDVLQRLQQNPETQNIPVVVVSADATPNQISQLLGAGAKEYLTKPLDVNQLLSVLDSAGESAIRNIAIAQEKS